MICLATSGACGNPSLANSLRTVVFPDPGPPETTKRFGFFMGSRHAILDEAAHANVLPVSLAPKAVAKMDGDLWLGQTLVGPPCSRRQSGRRGSHLPAH